MKIKSLRWWVVGLMIIGLIINYLARNTLSVAAPTMMIEMNMTTEEYSWVVVAWTVGYALMQPVAGYIIDAIGIKLGFALFAIAWSVCCALAAFATGWQSLAFFRGLLGMTEAAGYPAGIKTTAEWFPARERSVALGWFNIGSALGALLAPPLVVWAILSSGWQLAFILTGVFGLIWGGLWYWLYHPPGEHPQIHPEERDYIYAGQEAKFRDQPKQKAQWRKVLKRRNFYAVAIARFMADPAWQVFNAWIPLYLMHERGMDIKQIALFAWLPFLAADLGSVVGGYLSPFYHRHFKVSLFTSRKLVMVTGCLCMIAPGCVGLAGSPYTAILLLCVGGFAHQMLSCALYSMTSDSFDKNDVATAAGLIGMCGFLGAAVYTAIMGVLVTKIGYAPLFAALSVLDLGAAAVIMFMARPEKPAQEVQEEEVAGGFAQEPGAG